MLFCSVGTVSSRDVKRRKGMVSLRSKDLLGIRELTREELIGILDHAAEMRKIVVSGDKSQNQALIGKSVQTLFYENSTRTRTSFELAAKYLGASTVGVAAASSSVAKGETLIDTGRNIAAMGTDAIVLRHPSSGAPWLLAKNVPCAVLNAGDGLNEHPTQALLDMLTIRRNKGGFEGLKVAIVGDILHSRVARSDLWALDKLGAKVTFCGLRTLLPREIEQLGFVTVTSDIREALKGADVVIALRIQLERQAAGLFPSLGEYRAVSGLNPQNIKLAKKDVIVMHPGPVNRGVELTSSLMDSSCSHITEQVTNGAAVRMAVLDLLINRREGK